MSDESGSYWLITMKGGRSLRVIARYYEESRDKRFFVFSNGGNSVAAQVAKCEVSSIVSVDGGTS